MALWRTYTPDGRVLDVEHELGEWVAVCGGVRGAASSAREAIAAALACDEPTIGTAPAPLEAWLEAQASRLEAEAG